MLRGNTPCNRVSTNQHYASITVHGVIVFNATLVGD